MYLSIILTVIIDGENYINKEIAYGVLKKNQSKIIASSVDMFPLAVDLYGRDAISEELYKRTIDRQSELTATERLVRSVMEAVKVSGGQYFHKLLQSLRECGQGRLADELHQCYIDDGEW